MPHLLAFAASAAVLTSVAAGAQSPATVQPAVPTPAVWNPAADYVTPGQDEPGYRSWYLALPERRIQVTAFNQYLVGHGVGGVLPTWQLLRTASMWQTCAAQPYEVPPATEWPNIVQTLRYVRDYVVPAAGPVEAVSVYRNPVLNTCAGGVPGSAHQQYSAIDMVPLRPTTREQLMETLCAAHLRSGSSYQVGLGFYAFLRFHVDSMRFRKWGMSEAPDGSPCRIPVASPPPKGIDMPPEEMNPPVTTTPPVPTPAPEPPLQPPASGAPQPNPAVGQPQTSESR